MSVFDATLCALGEGPLWHPQRNTLFWFDILGKQMFERGDDVAQHWSFDAHYSAAGWIDRDSLLLASETGLWRFDIATGAQEQLCALEADNAITRSNDGRADPWGGFWIGTMGKAQEQQAGAIYRYHRGEVRQIADKITVSNAICFAPDGTCAYYTDTVTQKVMCQSLSASDGWPNDAPRVLIDLSDTRQFPDGAVTDAAGNIWTAIWGSACVICFDAEGQERQRVELPARQTTCPAFGGPELRDLYVTSAAVGLTADALTKRPQSGATFVIADVTQGRAEPQVIL